MDEDEWTDHNFGTSANELASSDDVSDIRYEWKIVKIFTSESQYLWPRFQYFYSDSEEEEEEENDEFAQALDIPTLDNNESLEFTRRFPSTSLPASPLTETPHRKNSGPNSHSLVINNVSRKILRDDETESSPSDDSAEHISYHEFESEGNTMKLVFYRLKLLVNYTIFSFNRWR